MGLDANSIAAIVGSTAKNVQFVPAASNVPRKILVIGTYDSSKTGIADEIPVQVFSASDAGNQFGFGSMIHRLVKKAFKGSNGIECFVIPQAETGASAAATGDILFAGTATESGTVSLYIAGELVSVSVAKDDAAADIATNVVSAITDDIDLPVSAAVNGGTPEQVDITAKSKGDDWGNNISISFNWGFMETIPSGITATVTDMASGAGTPDIADALDGLGTGDNANDMFATDVVHGYGYATAILDDISAYNGEGNDYVGLYSKTVHRPFRCLHGDTSNGSVGLSALIAIGDARKQDRTNGIIAVPGSPNHPSEIAAQAIGIMAKINNNIAAQSYIGQLLSGVIGGAYANQWTSEYDNRDSALKAGISPTTSSKGVVKMSNVATFYHPDNVPIDSNGFRSMRNISIIQNDLYNTWLNFSQEKWQGIFIVDDVAKVSNATDREKAKDVDAVMDDVVALVKSYESHGWIYSASFTIDKLKEGIYITIRAGGTGFTIIKPMVLSGEGGIFDNQTYFDTSLAVFTG